MKTLVLALGNPILSDDAVGWEVADRITGRAPDLNVLKESNATMDLIPTMAGYERLIIIDAIKTGSAEPGTLHRFTLDDFASTIRPTSPHDVNFATAFEMGRQMGYEIPPDIRIYGVEVQELNKFAEGCTPEVAAAIDGIADRILAELSETPC